MLPIRARVDLGAMAMKRYSTFPKLQHYWNLTIRLFSVIPRTLVVGSQYNLQPQLTGQPAMVDMP